MSGMNPLQVRQEIEQRLGYFPSFFTPAAEIPQVFENLWSQTVSTYLENPISSFLKEKIFTVLSRICRVPYCLMTHACVLRSLGMTPDQLLALLEEDFPKDQRSLEESLDELRAFSAPLDGNPEPNSALEKNLLRAAVVLYLNPAHSDQCQQELRRLLGPAGYSNLIALLTYVKTSHTWVETQPGISCEADRPVQAILSAVIREEPRLRKWLGTNKMPAKPKTRTIREQATGGTQQTPAAPELTGMKILVVDEDVRVRNLLRSTLSERGALVVDAQSTAQGIVALKHARDAREPFTLVFIECRMAGLKGLEIEQHLKDDPESLQKVIVLLPEEHWNSDAARVLELGVGGYLIKPITGTALQECIANALGLEAPVVVPASTPKAEPSRPRLRILAADDSRDGRALIQWCLDSGVYQVDFAENGRVAVDMFRMAKYDLVIMDIQMPDMDGYAATKAIRAWEKNSSAKPTPIIALTAYSAVEDAQKSLRAGCMAYLTKPITKERLREAIQLHAQRFAR